MRSRVECGPWCVSRSRLRVSMQGSPCGAVKVLLLGKNSVGILEIRLRRKMEQKANVGNALEKWLKWLFLFYSDIINVGDQIETCYLNRLKWTCYRYVGNDIKSLFYLRHYGASNLCTFCRTLMSKSKNHINPPTFFSLRDNIYHHLCESILSYKKSLESWSVQPKQRTTGPNSFRNLSVMY